MKNDSFLVPSLMALGLLLCVCLFGILRYVTYTTASRMKQQAVDRGVARWVVDPATGEKSLEWCTCFGDTERDK